MADDYEPPLRFRSYVTTAARVFPEDFQPRPERKTDWVPYVTDIPPGNSPQAVRLIRHGEPPATIRLLSAQAYKIGRYSSCEMLFRDSTISRVHGLLYFSPEISCWVYRDPISTRRSFLWHVDAPTRRREVQSTEPTAIVAGYVIELGDARNRLEFLEAVPKEAAGSGVVDFRSRAARELELSVQAAAGKTGPVLLFGPSGSGKTFLAQRIHELSGRKGSYVELNCGRLPRDSNQLQSELLGHVRGAYTGAVHRREGALFQADRGTLFLDEVESLPPEAQVFLLDLLEGKAPLRPLGSDKALPRPNARFICSTKVPFNETTLREDLVNRLVRGHRIIIPTLAERREDIPLLVESILAIIKGEAGVEATITAEAMTFLIAHDWPGHVRQLKELLYSTTDGHHGSHVELTLSAFKKHLASEAFVREGRKDDALETQSELEPQTGPIETSPVEAARKRPIDMTRDDVEDALRRAGGVMKVAAELLGCSPTTLREKRREFGL